VHAGRFEERQGGQAASGRASRRADGLFIQGLQDLILLLGRSRRKLLHSRKHFVDSGLEFRQALGIGLLIFFCKSDQSPVDEKYDARFVSTRRVGRGNDAGRDSADLSSLFGRKEFKLGGGSGRRRLARVAGRP
jgi:hypothetical protein